MVESRQETTQTRVVARGGMVTSMHPAAARAGGRRLALGGNAVDAFLEAALATTVTEPFMSNLGGHGSAVVRLPHGRVETVEFVCRAPIASITSDTSVPFKGARSIPVPTTATGFAVLHSLYATTARDALAETAASLAESGVEVEGYTAGMISREAWDLREDTGAAKVFLRDGLPLRPPMSTAAAGDRLSMADYATALRAWATQGETLLREGEVFDSLVDWMGANGGFVTARDLAEMPGPSSGRALSMRFGDFEVHGPTGPSGFPFVAQCLGMLADLDPDEVELGGCAYYHRLIETFRIAFADRDRWLGDPDGGRSPFESFFSEALWQARAAEVSWERRMPRIDVRDLGSSGFPTTGGASGGGVDGDGGCTTHVNVVDGSGMAVSGTFTLGHPFGARVVVPPVGLLLLNTLYQFSREPGHPNEIRTWLRPVWNGSPIIVTTRSGELVLSLGAPGATRIPTALVQVLVLHLKYGLELQAAIDYPRVHAEGDAVELDDRASDPAVTGLKALGHTVTRIREGASRSNFARPTAIGRLADGALQSGLDAWRLATAVGVA